MNFLGLDVSTSVVGVCILDENFKIVLMTHIDLGKLKDFWSKVDFVHEELSSLFTKHSIDATYVEEPANRFSAGQSSAHTINTLLKFNALVSWKVRDLSKVPVWITAAEARKACGLVMQRVSKCGMSHKEQVFSQVTAPGGFLHNVTVPLTKTGKPKSTFYDEMDAYVIARAGLILHKQG